MNKVWLVAKWEFLQHLKLKQEIISYLVMLVLYAGVFGVQYLYENEEQDTVKLGVTLRADIKFPDFVELEVLQESIAPENAYQVAEAQSLDALLIQTDEFTFTLYVKEQSSWIRELESALESHSQEILLERFQLNVDQLSQLKEPISLDIVNQAEQNKGVDVKVLGMLVSILTAIAVFNSFGLSFTSVTQEKQHRVTEQLLTCINFQQWIDGKAIGLCLASIKSLISTAIFIFVIYMGISLFSYQLPEGLGLSFSVVVPIMLFCVLGIIFWNYVFVGFSATIDDPNHSGKTGVMLLPMIPVMLVFLVLEDPGSNMAVWLSYLPLTSITFMPMRIASMAVPWWQVAISLGLLIAFIYLARLYATRIFRANITLFGKEPTWYQILKSMQGKA
ncbi:MAG: hypothetical protein GJ680_08205 [Alteromonadaceae bacterium]|nr:hypothetical protein [Alteromonadaceae bacterium]